MKIWVLGGSVYAAVALFGGPYLLHQEVPDPPCLQKKTSTLFLSLLSKVSHSHGCTMAALARWTVSPVPRMAGMALHAAGWDGE